MDEIPDEVRSWLGLIIEEARDAAIDHLKFLAENPDEPDRDLQRAECERAVELGAKAQLLFPVPVVA